MDRKLFLVVFALLGLSLTADAGVIKKSRTPGLLVTQGGEDPDPEVQERRNFVQQMMKDAWDDYERYAWGENELKPVSKEGQDGGIYGDSKIGATIIDALDTLWIMGYEEEFNKGRLWIADNFDFTKVNTTLSLFETNIRIVGGFLTVYALTGDYLFLFHAHTVARTLLPAFDTPSGFPLNNINPMTGVVKPETTMSMAGLGTLALEFRYLSEATGDPIFAEKVDKIQQNLFDIQKPKGFIPNTVDVNTGEFADDHVSMGAGADSMYEYFLKSWIQTQDRQARQLYDDSLDAFVTNGLVKTSKPSNLMYIAEIRDVYGRGEIEDVGSHLECFAGGMFYLGAVTDPRDPGAGGKKYRDMEIGQNFTNTCHESYIRSASHIGPEVFRFTDEAEAVAVNDWEKYYILRPEVIESYFVLYRLTKDKKYRDWAWDAAQAIQRYSKAGPGRGYSGLRNVYATEPEQDDVQQTFFLAETLKYLYLIFSTDDLISLNEWVFNTECHPLPIKGKNPMF